MMTSKPFVGHSAGCPDQELIYMSSCPDPSAFNRHD
jgi:hypothetical protein